MYNFISHYYDMLFPYDVYVEWKCMTRPIIQKSRAIQCFKERKEKPLVVDAGCGSGAMASLLAVWDGFWYNSRLISVECCDLG